MTTFDGGATAIQRQDGTWATPEDVRNAPAPRPWADLLSQFWGARSLHGAVFREPRGVVFWHCEKCRVPTNPSGTRTWDGALTTRRQVARYCEAVQHLRQREAEMGMIHGRAGFGALVPDDVMRGPAMDHFVAPIVTEHPQYAVRLTGVEAP